MKKNKNKDYKKSAIDEAQEYGIDLSLIEANLAKTPEQRIRDMSNAAEGISFLRNAVNDAYAK